MLEVALIGVCALAISTCCNALLRPSPHDRHCYWLEQAGRPWGSG